MRVINQKENEKREPDLVEKIYHRKSIPKTKSHSISKILIGLAVIIILCITLAGTFAFKTYSRIVVKPNAAKITTAPGVTASPTPTPDPLAPYTVLVMGYGGGNHAGGRLTDTMIAAHVEPRRKNVTLISIPRDLWVELPTKETQTKGFKINAAYAIGSDDRKYPNKPVQFTGEAGGGEMAKLVSSQVIGLPINGFVTLNFSGFERAIDALGGVTVKVPVTFDDTFYPIEGKEDDVCDKSPEEVASISATIKGEELERQFTCRFELLHFDAGNQAMDGKTALKFVRSRHSSQDGGDFGRSRRQQALITAVKQKVLSIGFLPKVIPFISTLAGDIQTDIDAGRLNEILSTHGELTDFELKTVSLTTQNVFQNAKSSDGQFILMPKEGENVWEGVHSFIRGELEASEEGRAN